MYFRWKVKFRGFEWTQSRRPKGSIPNVPLAPCLMAGESDSVARRTLRLKDKWNLKASFSQNFGLAFFLEGAGRGEAWGQGDEASERRRIPFSSKNGGRVGNARCQKQLKTGRFTSPAAAAAAASLPLGNQEELSTAAPAPAMSMQSFPHSRLAARHGLANAARIRRHEARILALRALQDKENPNPPVGIPLRREEKEEEEEVALNVRYETYNQLWGDNGLRVFASHRMGTTASSRNTLRVRSEEMGRAGNSGVKRDLGSRGPARIFTTTASPTRVTVVFSVQVR